MGGKGIILICIVLIFQFADNTSVVIGLINLKISVKKTDKRFRLISLLNFLIAVIKTVIGVFGINDLRVFALFITRIFTVNLNKYRTFAYNILNAFYHVAS